MGFVRCRACGESISRPEPGVIYCPRCGRPYAHGPDAADSRDRSPAELPDDLVPVARAGNLAEAGYFQAVLDKRGIIAYIDTRHPEATPDLGPQPAVLLVHDGQADVATTILQTAATRDEDVSEGDADASAGALAEDTWSWWQPVLVAGAFVAAGLLLLHAIRSVPTPPGPAKPAVRHVQPANGHRRPSVAPASRPTGPTPRRTEATPTEPPR